MGPWGPPQTAPHPPGPPGRGGRGAMAGRSCGNEAVFALLPLASRVLGSALALEPFSRRQSGPIFHLLVWTDGKRSGEGGCRMRGGGVTRCCTPLRPVALSGQQQTATTQREHRHDGSRPPLLPGGAGLGHSEAHAWAAPAHVRGKSPCLWDTSHGRIPVPLRVCTESRRTHATRLGTGLLS